MKFLEIHFYKILCLCYEEILSTILYACLWFSQAKVDWIAQKMKFSIKDFLSKCDQIRSLLWIWSYLLNKSLMENLTFCAVLK